MESIIISGMPASGKTTAARLVAKLLSMQATGGTDILMEIAKEHNYRPSGDNWWDTPEGIKFLRERASNPEYDIETDRRLIEKIKQGGFVVTSYTLPWLTEFGFKVWLSASVETRAKRMAERDHISVDEAKQVIEIRDAENKDLYEKLYGIKFGSDLSPFHLVLNVDNMGPEEVANSIAEKAKAHNSTKG